MSRSLALSLLAAISGSTYAPPVSAMTTSKTNAAPTQVLEPAEITEQRKIMNEARRQIGSELSQR